MAELFTSIVDKATAGPSLLMILPVLLLVAVIPVAISFLSPSPQPTSEKRRTSLVDTIRKGFESATSFASFTSDSSIGSDDDDDDSGISNNQGDSSKNKTISKATKVRKAPSYCPFSKETSFLVEKAENLPSTPLDHFEDWDNTQDDKPLGLRWLNANLSGQDTPGMLRAGLKRFRNAKFFLIQDKLMEEELTMKAKALADPQRFPGVFVTEDDSVQAQQETLDLFLSYLPRRYPDKYQYDADKGTIHVVCIDKTFRIKDYAHRPLELCELIVQEDLILMRPPKPDTDETSYAMAAAGVVFSFGELPEKLGKPVEFIHAPVPGYEQHLRKSMNLMFAKLQVEKPLWRNNWGISPSGQLDNPLYGSESANKQRRFSMPTVDQIKSMHLKVEYQTIRRLPVSNYLLFTVRTFSDPVFRLEEFPIAAACLAKSIRGMSSAMRAYKGIDDKPTCDILLQYLDGISTEGAAP